MKHIEISVINAKDEQQALLEWAARVDAGEEVVGAGAKSRLSFSSYAQLHAVLTDKRMSLLEYVAQHEGLSIRQLAGQLGRDYRNVYDDVQMLAELELIEKRASGLFAPYDDISIHKTLRRVD
jgi:predicted transcriptional regulator